MPDYEVKVEPSKDSKEKPAWVRQSEDTAIWLDERLGMRFWTLAAIIVAGFVFGTPHLLISYHCIGPCGTGRAFSCDYLGIGGWRAGIPARQGRCSMIRLF
ncbi:conserved hypothetical protein [Hyphomicrobiales bacterium]|nr:conserved hypothetical protein [Hyphomicrobiales bacterium]CAH1698729.1 conserved hypothetical protein [Hyphomicrobiales bacterium]CAI0342377.1 conserved hypothetical protein [Hyphomicrobiales bacterium]